MQAINKMLAQSIFKLKDLIFFMGHLKIISVDERRDK